MLKQLLKIPLYHSFRRFGRPRMLPFSYTVSVTFKCNSRCSTCFIWERKGDELSREEFRQVFHGLGKNPYWVTISGGEPFVRADTDGIIKDLYDECRPRVINIPTNGILSSQIPGKIEEIAKHCSCSNIVVNLSLDETGEKHDAIRNVPGNFKKAMETYNALKAIKAANLTVGIHTVISRFNIKRFRDIYTELMALSPDSYITEIAENRRELLTLDKDIAPSRDEYIAVIDFLVGETKKNSFKGMGRLAKAIRLQYYSNLKKDLLTGREVVPCYAGITTAHIAPDGNVWFCCVKAEPAGNLRDNGYELSRIWFTEKAAGMRADIRKAHCHCPLANMGYTNIMMHPSSLLMTGMRLIKG